MSIAATASSSTLWAQRMYQLSELLSLLLNRHSSIEGVDNPAEAKARQKTQKGSTAHTNNNTRPRSIFAANCLPFISRRCKWAESVHTYYDYYQLMRCNRP